VNLKYRAFKIPTTLNIGVETFAITPPTNLFLTKPTLTTRSF